jgi:predicted RNA-binding protein
MKDLQKIVAENKVEILEILGRNKPIFGAFTQKDIDENNLIRVYAMSMKHIECKHGYANSKIRLNIHFRENYKRNDVFINGVTVDIDNIKHVLLPILNKAFADVNEHTCGNNPAKSMSVYDLSIGGYGCIDDVQSMSIWVGSEETAKWIVDALNI